MNDDVNVTMRHFSKLSVMVVVLTIVCATTTAYGQWYVYMDDDSESECGVINTVEQELVVRECDDALVIVTDADRVIPNSYVDDDGNVFLNGQAFGFIAFDLDGDEYRTLWWILDDESIVDYDEATNIAYQSDVFAEDFTDVACNAELLWDGTADCAVDITIGLCGQGAAGMAMTMMGLLAFMGFRRFTG